MRCYFNNLIEDAELVASSTASSSDVNQLKVAQLSGTFKFGTSDVNLVIDLGGAKSIGSFICDIGTLTGLGTYTLEANTIDAWSSPAYSETLNVTDSCIYLDLDVTYQFFRLKITDSTEVELGYISIGESYLQLPGINPEATLNFNTTSKPSYSVSGQVQGDVGYEYLSSIFNFPQITELTGPGLFGSSVAGRQDILGMWSKVHNVQPIWVMLWANNLDEYAPVFCVLDQKSISFNKLKYGKFYSTSIKLMEVK